MIVHVLVYPALRVVVRPGPWCCCAAAAAVNWLAAALRPWLPIGLVDAGSAGLLTGWCLGPGVLWVHGQHPRQLMRRRAGGDEAAG